MSKTDTIGTVHFINTGLQLERDQLVTDSLNNSIQLINEFLSSRLKILAVLSTKDSSLTQLEIIVKARNKLQKDLISWWQNQFIFCPLLKPYINAVDPKTPELDKLLLPSSFDPALHEHLGLTSLGAIEYHLQEGQAYDALNDLREKIKIYNTNSDYKKKSVFGQSANTRTQAFLKQLSADKVNAADKYRIARQALISLGLSNSDPMLQELHNDQLYGKDTSQSAKLGDSKQEDPWFWTVGRPSSFTVKKQTEWSLECRC